MVLRLCVTGVALLFVIIHLCKPTLAIDVITLALLGIALIPWLSSIFKSIEISGIGKFEFQELGKAVQHQAKVTSYQTLATVITWVQAQEIRESRRLLYELEDTLSISTIPAARWRDEWRQAADRVGQAFNSAAIIARLDPSLHELWIQPTRRAILRSWNITQPRIRERREAENDLWRDFEWLSQQANSSTGVGSNLHVTI